MTATFTADFPIRFNHVDAAGMVFYPRYFELLNACVEDWFASMGADFRTLHLEERLGTPTVKLEVEFTAPAMLGDVLEVTLEVRQVGRSSCRYGFTGSVAGEAKLKGEAVLVCMDLGRHKAVPWPERVRAGMLHLQEQTEVLDQS